MVRVGIVGISGFTAETLLKVFTRHKRAEVTYCASQSHKNQKLQEVYPAFKGALDITAGAFSIPRIKKTCDVVFLCVPHTQSMAFAPQLLKAGKKVIDLSGDYRFKNAAVYEKYYQVKHTDKGNLKNAIYGLTELNRQNIAKAFLVANPGCYPTAAILALYPLLKEGFVSEQSVVIDAKSGISGAGRKASLSLLYTRLNENISLYKPVLHQHVPEMEECLKIFAGQKKELIFVPHLVPLDRGIFMTLYVYLKKKTDSKHLEALYRKLYFHEPFIRLFIDGFPELKNVAYTNFCDIGMKYFKDKNLVVIGAAIDNLMKGASGQAVQNMNIMYGMNETEGLL